MKRSFTLLISLLITLSLLFSLCGCGTHKSSAKDPLVPETKIRVGALKGPTAMGMVFLMENHEKGITSPLTYDFTIRGAIDEVTTALLKGDLDVAAVPANLASILYHNTNGQIQVLTINTLGVLYLVEKGNTITSIRDLKGKTIYSSGKGATPEYSLKYLLEANGLDPEKDVTIEYKSEHTECVSALSAKDGAVALLPQPFVTTAQMNDNSIRIAIDLNKAWNDTQKDTENKSALLTGVLVARKDFIRENQDALDLFLEQYEASVDQVNTKTKDAAALIEKYGIIKAAVAEKALPYCCITYIDGEEMQRKLEGYLQILYGQNPTAVGNALPEDEFYYEK